MAGSRERERRRARERYERQREIRLARQRKLRQRFGIGLAVACVLGLVAGLTIAFAGGEHAEGGPKKPVGRRRRPPRRPPRRPSATATASAAAVTEPATHCTYTTRRSRARASQERCRPRRPNYKAAYTATINTNLGTIVH